jgi:anti-sigma factor RsiW
MATTHPETALVPYLRGELRGDELASVRGHLEDCAQCRESIDSLASTIQHVASHLSELPTPEWIAYRSELRRKIAVRNESRHRWWRPGIAWAGLATAGAAIATLILFISRPDFRGATPQMDQLAMEQQMSAADVGLLRNYGVVEKLDLLENYDVIEHLDELPSSDNNHDTRS